MLTSRPTAGKLRVARNLMPTRDGAVEVRPPARQVVDRPVAHCVPWGARLLFSQGGRLMLWDGATHDLGVCGPVLDAASFQALTDLGEREDRLYLADGVHPLRYVSAGDEGWAVHAVTNTCVDPETEEPLDLPVPIAIAAWNSRLWISTGSNFVQHSENDDPAYWNPLWTIDCQGAMSARVLAVRGMGDALVAATSAALWAVTGKSQFDFQRAAIADGGVAGTHCLAADGDAAWWMGPLGVWTAGAAQAFSLPVQDWFDAGVQGSLAVDRPHRRLLVCLNGRGLAADLTSGAWAEFCPTDCFGVFASEGRAGWFGPDGLWVLGSETDPWTHPDGRLFLADDGSVDLDLSGTAGAVCAHAETWPDLPNLKGRGRALLNRAHLSWLASAQANARLEVLADDVVVHAEGKVLRAAPPTWDQVGTGAAQVGDWAPVLWEVVPRAQGQTFTLRVLVSGRARLQSYGLEFRGGG